MNKLLASAEGYSCIRCGKSGETRNAHYNGIRQHLYNKGRGTKCDDIMTAHFCHACDQLFSEGTISAWASKEERSEEFLHYIALTNIRRRKGGVFG